MISFFEELRRRKVYRLAAGYVVAAWFVIQVVATLFPFFELPVWSVRLVVAIVLAGFPFALAFSWAFEFGRGGLTREVEDAGTGERAPKAVGRRRVALLVLAGAVVSILAAYFLIPRARLNNIGKSIAVLPFENFSADKENQFFADGIQDDVLTSLSRIGELKVISRTSVMQYRGQARNMPQIGRALGVSAIVEGSVRRMGQKVRVTVQLIKAATDEHIWAQSYDRDLGDAFAIQSELAQEIASQLNAKLSPAETARIQHRPTTNNEAYRLYQQ